MDKSYITADLDEVLDADYSGVWQKIYVNCPDCPEDGACVTCQSTGVIESYEFRPDQVPTDLRKHITGYTMVAGRIVPKMRDKDKAATLRAQVTTGVVSGSMNVTVDYANMTDDELSAKLALLRKA